jgi:hypothetical protein
MRKNTFIGFVLLHFALSLVGFYGINALAIGAQDSGASSTGWSWIEPFIQFGLLQPLAFWLLLVLPVRWWTWLGLTLTATLLLANSLIACGLAASLFRRLRRME